MISPEINLRTHVDDVVNFVRWEGLRNVVLCGHSYGGMVITDAAEVLGEAVSAMVFLDAFVPETGKSAQDYSRSAGQPSPNSSAYFPPISAEAFAVNEADRAWVNAQCTLQPRQTFRDKAGPTTVRDAVMRKYYVRATKWPSQMMDHFAEYCRTHPGWQVVEMAHGHDLMLDAPQEVANLLLTAAKGN